MIFRANFPVIPSTPPTLPLTLLMRSCARAKQSRRQISRWPASRRPAMRKTIKLSPCRKKRCVFGRSCDGVVDLGRRAAGGAMRHYMASLAKLLARQDKIYWPGHGGEVKEPQRYVRALIQHRRVREKSIPPGSMPATRRSRCSLPISTKASTRR
jgi:hypothetical protein